MLLVYIYILVYPNNYGVIILIHNHILKNIFKIGIGSKKQLLLH